MKSHEINNQTIAQINNYTMRCCMISFAGRRQEAPPRNFSHVIFLELHEDFGALKVQIAL